MYIHEHTLAQVEVNVHFWASTENSLVELLNNCLNTKP